MPYIPMTIGEKRIIVRRRLRRMGVPVGITESWLDIQIICREHGLDITEMLRPQIPDSLLIEKANGKMDKESPTIIIANNGAKVITEETQEKPAIGFTPEHIKPEKENDDENYTL